MIRRILPTLRLVTHRLWAWRIRTSLNRADRCRFAGLDLVVLPGVLHPGHFRSSRLLARHLQSLPLEGLRVADVGTGSGLLGLRAARSGAIVTALDIDPRAVACAQANVDRNDLGGRMRVRLSDVFDGAPEGERYDLIVTNPPFYPREARGPADYAFAAGDEHGFMARFTGSLPDRLAPGGEVLMIHSSDTDFGPVTALMTRQGLAVDGVFVHRGLFETLTIRAFRASGAERYLT